jgi:hypothetical protein
MGRETADKGVSDKLDWYVEGSSVSDKAVEAAVRAEAQSIQEPKEGIGGC